MLWIVLTLMVALAAVGLTIPIVRRHEARRGTGVVEVLKAQLGEIEAQAALGGLAPDEAEALKADVKRRVLAEGRIPEPPRRPLPDRALVPLALGLVAIVVLAATGLYLKIGHPQPPGGAAAGSQANLPPGHPGGDPASMIAALEGRMKTSPNDAEGWRMLGWSYLQVGRNADAAQAYGRAAALDPRNAEYLSAQGEATVLAAGDQVTPDAEAAFRKAVSIDPVDPRARYYLAIARYQKGDHKGAMDDWIALLKSAPADAAWAPQVRSFVEKVAASDHIDVSGRLPPAPAAAPTAEAAAPPPPGPTQEQMTAAGQMSAGDRQAMIAGMVQRLSDRLVKNPRDLDGWQRLIRARMVLGQPDAATQAYRDGMKAFAGSAADQASLRQTASGLGVPGI